MDDTSSPPTQAKRQKAQSLEDILLKLGPITSVSYEPFKCEPQQTAKALLPTSFPPKPHPFDYFSLFFTRDLFQTITTNTNRYERAREWTDLLVEELYVFLGAIIYIGVHEEPQIEMYWNLDFNKGPLYSIISHISRCRFKQIKRYCHISCPKSNKRNRYHLPSNKVWWYKLKPLASSIQASSQRYYSPSSEVSIDELMVRCFGRYDIVLHPTLINTGCLVRNLAPFLLRRYLTIYMDNYFMLIPLFSELRAYKFGVLIDIAYINTYRLYRLYIVQKRPLMHLQFRIKLYYKPFRYFKRVKLQSLRHLHYWEKRPKRGTCAWWKGVNSVPKRLVRGCVFCNMPLCLKGEC
ncbi:uncharacterized protein K441DRAFT_653614, partial [Cenococcum geophilum 1.58]|uniref:uncharacterized protein n=1 Tax=Cenococcum geophilum 1.58 TaxID=794803 RepID=UPI00358FD538